MKKPRRGTNQQDSSNIKLGYEAIKMENGVEAEATQGGRPVMLPDETLYETMDDVTLYDGNNKTGCVRCPRPCSSYNEGTDTGTADS